MNIDKKELENFLYYLLDKIKTCYKEEAKKAVKEFLERGKE